MNAFTDLAARQISAPEKAKLRAAAKRASKAAERALAERDTLARLWQHYQRERLAALLAGPFGSAIQDLIALLERLQLDQADALIALLNRGPWRQADADTRLEVLRLVNASIISLRERHGLEPFDDPLPPSAAAFQIIRGLLAP